MSHFASFIEFSMQASDTWRLHSQNQACAKPCAHVARRVQEAIVVATAERDGLDASLAAAMKELEESAGNRSQVEAEWARMNAEKEELQAQVSALSHAKAVAEEKALALEGQMEALQVSF
jgi:chromosome segregation ATPase